MGSSCPVCGGTPLTSTVRREQLPAMQNYVYRTLDRALSAARGKLEITVCNQCGYAFNAAFDSSLLVYDQGYDNSVPSRVMDQYYRHIAAYLYEKYSLENGLVFDVGCGKGTFLHTLTELYPNVRGIGVDPSYEGEQKIAGKQLTFVRDIFKAEQVKERPSLVICRHVLEHIPQPPAFLQSISDSLSAYPGTPFFLEVPDALWILENNAFWDFCYEHVNYFTSASLNVALDRGGFTPCLTQNGYGSQYLWIEGVSKRESAKGTAGERAHAEEVLRQFQSYVTQESSRQTQVLKQLLDLKNNGYVIAVWGMATKGVIFSNLIDPKRSLIDHCIDVNTSKQGGFLPVTGHRIESPDVLKSVGSKPLVVVIMNNNYRDEIADMCAARGLHPQWIAF